MQKNNDFPSAADGLARGDELPADGTRRSGSFRARTLLVTLGSLGSVVFVITAYALTHMVQGLPGYVSVVFALVVFAAITLSIVVAMKLFDIFRSSKAGLRGARLQQRLVGLLSLVAVLPAIVAFALTGTVLRAFSDEYFVDRVTEANLVARDLANGYATAESRKMGIEVLQLASDLARQASAGLTPQSAPIGFRRYLLGQSILRDFSAVVLLDDNGTIIAEVSQQSDKRYRLPPHQAFVDVSTPGAVPYKFNAHDQTTIDAYYALLRLGAPDEGFLVAYKEELPALSSQLVRVRAFRDQTNELKARLGELSRMFAVGYGLVMLLLLLAAVWIGLVVANAIVGPVRRLATAAEAVSSGDLKSRVEVRRGDGELGDLGHTFNEMTRQLEAQRADLVAANAQSDARRRFIETVVAGVPAGVLNVATDGRVALANPSADRILGGDPGRLVGRRVQEVSPELGELLAKAASHVGTDFRDQVELHRRGVARIINVRISPDDPERRTGFVVTLDDITELVAAQRNAAWGDVARRIAHEIKNPLTPIQLSAERLKRKYGRQIEGDREVFDRCTDTIIRHVGDIGRMVNEFSSFARMPEPIIADEDLCEVARSASFSFSVAHPGIAFVHDMKECPLRVRCDGRLIGQAIVNLIKNAVESILENTAEETGKIVISVYRDGQAAVVEIADSGKGLPAEGRSRLTEPYMTTRVKGTGLGLAIVRKAVEEHGGTFSLIDQGAGGGRGATARITLPSVHLQAINPESGAPEQSVQEA